MTSKKWMTWKELSEWVNSQIPAFEKFENSTIADLRKISSEKGWHNMKDGNPNTDSPNYYLVHMKNGIMGVRKFYPSEESWVDEPSSNPGWNVGSGITHWMELPDDPDGGVK